MALQRKTKFNELLFQGEVWIPAAELLKKYRCPRLLTLTEKDYSKLGAIDSPGGVVTKALCRALLTDMTGQSTLAKASGSISWWTKNLCFRRLRL